MYPVSSGFEEWIHLFVQDSFGQKRETLPGAIVIRRAYLKYVIERAKRAPHWGVQSRFHVIYILNIQPFRVEYQYILYRGYNICRYFTRKGFKYLVYYIGYSLRGTTVSVATYPLTMRSISGGTLGWNIELYSTSTNQFDWSVSRAYVINIYIYVYMSVCLVCQINCVGGIT